MVMLIRELSALKDGWENEILEMSDGGLNRAELLEFLKIPPESHSRFLAESDDYADVFTLCQMKHDAYWNRLFRENVENRKDFDTSGWKAYMRENCGYEEKKPKKPRTKKEIVEREELKARFLNGRNNEKVHVIG